MNSPHITLLTRYQSGRTISHSPNLLQVLLAVSLGVMLVVGGFLAFKLATEPTAPAAEIHAGPQPE